ncbi:MAG: hypothetical protein Q8R55_06380 [Candidatus Taylorbacteria bacterium]|nr:hypothetical protein [Candidatus Taylorbacteria bacterium]
MSLAVNILKVWKVFHQPKVRFGKRGQINESDLRAEAKLSLNEFYEVTRIFMTEGIVKKTGNFYYVADECKQLMGATLPNENRPYGYDQSCDS